MEKYLFSWTDISVSVPLKKSSIFKRTQEKKVLLHKESGSVQNGTLVALIGPSGAGKTTLMTTLSGKTRKYDGTIAVNGKKISGNDIGKISGFVFQFFLALDKLTVSEHLRFMTALTTKLPSKQRVELVNKLLNEMNLEKCAASRISNISGGEEKKLALAVQLINDPLILFVDEPTTGLDSTSAVSIIEILQARAVTSGRIIIVSVNQPSSQVYNFFDDIILLGYGRSIFHGSRRQIKDFFDSVDLVCPETFNPPEFYIKCIINSRSTPGTLQRLESLGAAFSKKFLELEDYQEKLLELQLDKIDSGPRRAVPIEIMWLLWRMSLNCLRNTKTLLVTNGTIVITAVILIGPFAGADYTTATGADNYNGVLYLLIPQVTFTIQHMQTIVMSEEASIFIQEQTIYSKFSYFSSEVLAFIPSSIINTIYYLILVLICIPLSGGAHQILMMFLILLLGSIVAGTFGSFLSANIRAINAQTIAPTVDMISIFLSGKYVKIQSIPSFISWLKYLTPFYYMLEAMTILHWHEVPYVECLGPFNATCHRTGNDILIENGFSTNYNQIYWNLLGMLGLFILWFILGNIGILRRYKN